MAKKKEYVLVEYGNGPHRTPTHKWFFDVESDKEAEEMVNDNYDEDSGAMVLYRLSHVTGWS